MGDGPFLCYKELNPASSVVGSSFFQSYNRFIKKSENFLCTITSSVINIYQVHEDEKEHSNGKEDRKLVCSLEMIKYYKLFGKLVDLQRLSRSKKEENDLLILAVDAGKLISFEYEIASNSIIDYPLYNLEENATGYGTGDLPSIITNGRHIYHGNGIEPIVKVNHEYQMIASVVYGENIFISTISTRYEVAAASSALPVDEEGALSEENKNGTASSSSTISMSDRRSFHYEKMIKNIHHHLSLEGPILDIVFLSGYDKPTLAVLHQEHYLPLGHAKALRNTCSLSVFSIDIHTQNMSFLWSKAHLPHDSIKLIELSSTAVKGNVLLICQNAILLLNEKNIQGLAMNSFASITVTKEIRLHPWNPNWNKLLSTPSQQHGHHSQAGLELDGSYWSEYGEDSPRETSILGVLRNGTIIIIRLLYVMFQIPSSLKFDVVILNDGTSSSQSSFSSSSSSAASQSMSTMAASPSCVSILPSTSSPSQDTKTRKDLLFIGSRLTKSFLFLMNYRKNEHNNELHYDQLENARKWLLNQITDSSSSSSSSGSGDNADASSSSIIPVIKQEATNEQKVDEMEEDGITDEERKSKKELIIKTEENNGGGADERMKHILSDYMDDEENMMIEEDYEINEEIISEERLFYHGKTAIESDSSYQITRQYDWIITLIYQDSLFQFGPIHSGTFTKSEDMTSHITKIDWERSSSSSSVNSTTTSLKTNQTAASYITDRDAKDSLLLSSGMNESTQLHRILQGIGFSKIGNRNFLGATRIFTLPLNQQQQELGRGNDDEENGVQTAATLLLVSYENKTRVMSCKIDHNSGNASFLHSQPSSASSAGSVSSDIKLQEFNGEDSSFFIHSSTIFIGKINSLPINGSATFFSADSVSGVPAPKDIVVQVFPLGVRLIELHTSFGLQNKPLQDMLLAEEIDIGGLNGKQNESLLSADVCYGYLVLLSNLKRLFILKYNQDDMVLELLYIKDDASRKKNQARKGEKEAAESNGRMLDGFTERKENGNDDERSHAHHRQNGDSDAMDVDEGAVDGGDRLPFISSNIVSVSLFYGSLDIIHDEPEIQEDGMNKATKRYDESLLTEAEKEEFLFYGCLIKDMKDHEKKNEKNSLLPSSSSSIVPFIEGNKEAGSAPFLNGNDKSPSYPYLTIYEENGNLSIIRLVDFQLVLSSNAFAMQKQSVSNNTPQKRERNGHSDVTEEETEEENRKLKNRYIIETKLIKMNYSLGDSSSSVYHTKIALFLLFHTGELVVYHGIERNGKVYGWYKAMTKIVHNKRFSYGKLLKGQHSLEGVLGMKVINGSSSEMNGQSIDSQQQLSYLDSDDYLQRGSSCLSYVANFHGSYSDAMLITSNEPSVYTMEKGCSNIMPLGFPETPFVNFGQFMVLPLYSSPASSVGSSASASSILATLWYEYEDIDVFKNPGNIKQRAQRQSTFGLYRLLPSQSFSPYDAVSYQSVEIGQTIHKMYELSKLTDNMTEQVLLDKKTYLLFSSKDITFDFSPEMPFSLLSEEENNEDVFSERYFPVVDSFANPDSSLAPHPLVKDKEFRISLLQAGKIVDSYVLGEREMVLDVIPLYVTIEKQQQQQPSQGGMMMMNTNNNTMKTYEKRVFILVSVLNKDYRGEDSQGGGKILLLGLDYAMFEEDIVEEEDEEEEEEAENDEKRGVGEEKGQDSTSSSEMLVVENASDNQPPVSSALKPEAKSSTSASSTAKPAKNLQQQFLGAIRPKLKLLWTGPGPASVIGQMPSFATTNSNNLNNPYNNPQLATVAPTIPTDSINSTHMFSNYVIATVGQTLYIYKLNPNTLELDQITFYFSQVSVSVLFFVKSSLLFFALLSLAAFFRFF
jgi:hypothetical protein